MSQTIDLRSDTVTQPTDLMRAAMMDAPLGDDVLGDDPTVHRLQDRCAELFGKEAACFVPSGSMANQACIRALTSPGDEILAHENSHIYQYEAGGPAALSGCTFAFFRGDRGFFTSEEVRQAIRPDDHHFPRSRLLVIENTNNRGGGTVWPLEQLTDVTRTAHDLGLRCHLDGARIWNACIATDTRPDQWACHFDTVSACFSKGLGAPVGSIVVGDRQTINQVHRLRKMLGGAMRQSGFLAAAALHGIEHHRERMVDDHRRARRLAEALADCPDTNVDLDAVDTNIVYFDTGAHDAREMQTMFESMDVKLLALGPHKMRAVLSMAVDEDDVDRAVTILVDVLKGRD